jgi:biopolymer transport protein ExbD
MSTLGWRRRKKYQPPKETGSFVLNITSMTDMFTILLVFLLQTYSVHETPFEPEKSIQLPMSNADVTPSKTTGVSVSLNELKFADQVVAQLDHGSFAAGDLSTVSGGESLIPKLYAALKGSSKGPGPLTVQADAALPYDVIKKVLHTAQSAGFAQIKLATVVEE